MERLNASDLYAHGSARFYDAFHGTYAADRSYFLRLARNNPGPVLEIACGTGRLGLELIRAGADYFGLDAAEGMLGRFREKWRERVGAGEAPVACGDMRRFELQRRFGLVLITFNSLQHLQSDAEVLDTFACCRRHLEPDGLFVFDVFNPDRRILERDPDRVYFVQRFLDEERGEWCDVSESNRYDPVSRINSIVWHYRYEKGEEGTFRIRMRQFFPADLDALVARAGFRAVNKWGDFAGSGFGEASPRQVFECRSV